MSLKSKWVSLQGMYNLRAGSGENLCLGTDNIALLWFLVHWPKDTIGVVTKEVGSKRGDSKYKIDCSTYQISVHSARISAGVRIDNLDCDSV